MKQFILSFLLFVFTLPLSAQDPAGNSSLYYYFGGKKIYLQESASQIYLRAKPAGTQLIKAGIRNNFGISEKAFTTLQSEGAMLISLMQDNKTGSKKDLLAFAKNNSAIELVRPAIVAPDGKEVVIDEGFYVKLKPGTTQSQLAAFALQMN